MERETGRGKAARAAGTSPIRSKRYRVIRRIVAGIVFASVIVSLIWHTGTGTLSALGISSIAAVCPLGQLETVFAGRSFMLHPLLLLLATVVATLLVGKAICSWACPVPYIQRFFHIDHRGRRMGGKRASASDAAPRIGASTAAKRKSGGETAKHVEGATSIATSAATPLEAASATSAAAPVAASAAALPPVGGHRDGIRLDSRHAVLAGALLSSLAFGFPVFCIVCPVGLSFATVIGIWHLFQYNEASWMLVLFPILLVIELVAMRKWCMTLCPISALASLISAGNKTCKPKVDDSKCLRNKGVDCRVCVETCPEEVDPHSDSIPECSKCGICVDRCPAQAIAMKVLTISPRSR